MKVTSFKNTCSVSKNSSIRIAEKIYHHLSWIIIMAEETPSYIINTTCNIFLKFPFDDVYLQRISKKIWIGRPDF